MRPGERIAVKSSYTRKHGLPFDNRGQTVSVMAIKAVGTITENMNLCSDQQSPIGKINGRFGVNLGGIEYRQIRVVGCDQ